LIRFCLLDSGSSGNAALVLNGSAKLLIDNGLSLKKVRERVAEIGESLDGLAGVLITHEHGDHVLGVGVMARKLGVPVYITPATHAALPGQVGPLPKVEHFEPGDRFEVGGLEIQSYSVAHDAADPVNFTVRQNGAKIGFATDVGYCSNVVRRALAGCNALVLESNYCPKMLRDGDYPPAVQHRIRSRNGHLSNQDMASLLSALRHDALKTVVLVHLSENNNTPEQAEALARQALHGHAAQLHIARRHGPTPVFSLGD